MKLLKLCDPGQPWLVALCLIAALVALTGCAADKSPATAAPPDARATYAATLASCAESIKDVVAAAGNDTAAKVVAVGAIERLCGAGGVTLQAAMTAAPAPPSTLGATLWQAALQVTDIALRGYGIKAGRDVSIVQSNNAANTAIASYAAFQGMAASGFGANAQIAAQIQAPAANVTTTLSGTGVIGSGTYTGPIATTTTTTTNPAKVCTVSAAGQTCSGP